MEAVTLSISDALARAFARNLERYLQAQCVQLLDIEIRLRNLHEFCDGCDCSRARCDQYVKDGAIACCPDCTHRWAVRP